MGSTILRKRSISAVTKLVKQDLMGDLALPAPVCDHEQLPSCFFFFPAPSMPQEYGSQLLLAGLWHPASPPCFYIPSTWKAHPASFPW